MKTTLYLVVWIATVLLAFTTCNKSDDDDSTPPSDEDNDDDLDADDEIDDDDDLDLDDEDTDDDGTIDDDTQFSCDDVWTDVLSGLTWTVNPVVSSPHEDIEWTDAVARCDDLICAEYGDWRLPSISELRSLIRGCPNTEYGGPCTVTDENPYLEDDGDSGGCLAGCGVGIGPADGCYWPEEMRGDCEIYWSSSTPTIGDTAWYVYFRQANLGDGGYGLSRANARCVRGQFSPSTH